MFFRVELVQVHLLAGEEALFKSMQVPYRISYCQSMVVQM
jgi:hypothetical protein